MIELCEEKIRSVLSDKYSIKPTRVQPWFAHINRFFNIPASTAENFYWPFDGSNFVSTTTDSISKPMFIGTFDWMVNAASVLPTNSTQFDVQMSMIEGFRIDQGIYLDQDRRLRIFASNTLAGDTYPSGAQRSLYYPKEIASGWVFSNYIRVFCLTVAGAALPLNFMGWFNGYRIFFT